MTRTVKIDMGQGPEDVPVLAAPYILAGLPDFIDLSKVTAKTLVDDPPLAPQISHQDTSAASLAKAGHVSLRSVYKTLADMEYDASWPRDTDTIRLFNASRDQAKGVISRAVRRAGEERSDVAMTIAAWVIMAPLFLLFAWLGLSAAAEMRNNAWTFIFGLLSVPGAALISVFVSGLLIVILPARPVWYIMLTLCALGFFAYGIFAEWHWMLEDWVLDWAG